MNTFEAIIKILEANAQKSTMGWAIEEEDFNEVAKAIEALVEEKK